MKVVIGVDSGGSNTRALAVTLEGERVGYAETGGGNPAHAAAHGENVRAAIRVAAESCGVGNVVRVVAGVAGYDNPKRDAWVVDATDVPGLAAERTHVNDAEVAHFGAFGGGPGIVTIQGTGSMILAILEDGRRVKNGDFFQYARAGAVWVGISAVQKLLTDPTASREEALREAAFAQWGVSSMVELRERISRQSELTELERSNRYGAIARAVTASAEAGGFFSQTVCTGAVREIVKGIRLLGPMFESDEVLVTMVGSCGRSQAIRSGVERNLTYRGERRYRIVEAAHPPVVGAVSMALQAEGVVLRKDVVGRLGEGL